MKSWSPIRAVALVCGVILGAATLAETARAATVTVCASGCKANTIQQGVEAAAPGDTVEIAPGTYVENVVIDRPLRLQGAGQERVRVVPAVSAPNPCDDSSLCGSLASNIVLVQADDVTIDGLTLDGDNPALTSGVVERGADIDARNGVIVDYRAGTFNALVVSHVTVKNVYFRGIYAGSGGTFVFSHDTVANVNGDPIGSIAIFNDGGAGLMNDNLVVGSNDGLASNWSTGTVFRHNRVLRSRSGIHSDNNGGRGGRADLIEDNLVERCAMDGLGIYVFAPVVQPAVQDNAVRACAVALGLYGGSNEPTPFTRNHLDGAGAETSDPMSSTGILVTTELPRFGFQQATGLFTSTSVTGFAIGVHVEAPGGFTAKAVLHDNAITQNGAGAIADPGASAEAEQNWWGCPTGPNSQPGCATVQGAVSYTPWLSFPPFVSP